MYKLFNRLYWISIFATILLISLVITIGITSILFYKSERKVEFYIHRILNATTIESAQTELNRTLEYIEYRNLTSGNTSLFFNKDPKNDIESWYKNLVNLKETLPKSSEKISTMKNTEILLKIKENLCNNQGQIIIPDAIDIYPLNIYFFYMFSISISLNLIFWLILKIL